jgi:DNA-binding response OmpR family regulator
MRNSWIVLSRETLVERVWGYDFVGETNRVDVYIHRLRGKIEEDPSNPRYLHTIRGLGYVFRVDAQAKHEHLRGNPEIGTGEDYDGAVA